MDGQHHSGWNPLDQLIAALHATDPNLNGLVSAPSPATQAQQMHHHQAAAPVPSAYNQATLNALLQQPNILSILSLLPQPPLPDPNAAPVMTRSGRPSRPPQFDDQVLQMQQAALAGLDPSIFAALTQQMASSADGFGGHSGGGLNTMLSTNGADALASGGAGAGEDVGGGQLDWWWPIQEEGEDEDPSYFPPSNDTPSGHLATPNYVFSPSNFANDDGTTAPLTFNSAPTNAHASGSSSSHFVNHSRSQTGQSMFSNGSYNNQVPESGNESAVTPGASTTGGGAKKPVKRSRKGKEKEVLDAEATGVDESVDGTGDEAGRKKRKGTEDTSDGKGGKKKKRVPMTPAEALARRKERNKLTAQKSREKTKNHIDTVEAENRQLKEELKAAKEEIARLKASIPPPPPPPRETPNIYDPVHAISGSTPPIHPFAHLPPTPQPAKRKPTNGTTPSSPSQSSKPKPKRKPKPKTGPNPVEAPADGSTAPPSSSTIPVGKSVPSDNNHKGVHGWEMVDGSSEEEESAVETPGEEESDSDSDYPAEPSEQIKRKQAERDALAAKRRIEAAAKRSRGVSGGSATTAGGGGTRSPSRSVVPEEQQQRGGDASTGGVAGPSSVPEVIEQPPSDPQESPEDPHDDSGSDSEDDDRSDDDDDDDGPADDDDDSDASDLYLPIRDVPIPSPPPGLVAAPPPPPANGASHEEAAGLVELATVATSASAAAAAAAAGPANKEVVDLLKALLTRMGGSV